MSRVEIARDIQAGQAPVRIASATASNLPRLHVILPVCGRTGSILARNFSELIRQKFGPLFDDTIPGGLQCDECGAPVNRNTIPSKPHSTRVNNHALIANDPAATL
jgi:hypothetical protein